MKRRTTLPLALGAAVAVFGAAGVWAASQVGTAPGPNSSADLNTFLGVTPTPPVLDDVPSADTGLASLRSSSKLAQETTLAWLRADISTAAKSVVSEQVNCSDAAARAVTVCKSQATQPATVVTLYRPVVGLPAFRVTLPACPLGTSSTVRLRAACTRAAMTLL